MQIDDDAIVCGKHISKYGITFKPSMLCAYPSHTKKTYKTKTTKKDSCRVIKAQNLGEISDIHSSIISNVILPIGSVWCNECRLRVHVTAIKINKNSNTTQSTSRSMLGML